jgi:mannose-6-phosphate isomerase
MLTPVLKERVWGTKVLPTWLPKPGVEGPIGEAWLTAEECVGGDGETLGTLVAASPGVFGAGDGAGFPLLLKLLFPEERLSVQVHPNDAQAQAMGLPRGKTECWYVVSAEPGATVAVGLVEPMSEDAMRAAIADGSIEAKMRYVPVKAGDMVYVDAGTVHAIGPGVVILETQQYSDVTYRLYDYGRPRELHLEAGLAVTRESEAAGLVSPVTMDGFVRLVASDYFVVDRFVADAALGMEGKMQVLVALGDGAFVGETALLPGHAVVLPGEGVGYAVKVPDGVEVVRVAQGLS